MTLSSPTPNSIFPMARTRTPLLLLLLLSSSAVHSRPISSILDTIAYQPSDPLADDRCEQSYGVLPCTRSAVGNLFLMVVYGYLMFIAATFLSDGSEMLLDTVGPGIVGGLLLPILGALPDAILILASGLSGNKETAQEQVLIGMGLLAGSTVMLLTILWGSCVVVGKCDLDEDTKAVDLQDTRRFSLFDSGISTDVQTSYAARIMVITVIPLVIVQLPRTLGFSSADHWTVLIALVLSIGLLSIYCLYQMYQPWILKRRLEFTKQRVIHFLRHEHMEMHRLGSLLTDECIPDENALEKLFRSIDIDSDKFISRLELAALIKGINFSDILDNNNAADKIMKDFDTSNDGKIDLGEFIAGMKRWLHEEKCTAPDYNPYSETSLPGSHAESSQEDHSIIESSDNEKDAQVEKEDTPKWAWANALFFLLLGTVLAAIFADPLVDSVSYFSSATNIPSFFISFIAMPLATNSSEVVSAIIFASRKKQKTASLTFSEIYGAATMNNTLCLSVFLALIYIRDLTWDFSSEVLIIILVCIIVGLFASFRITFPLWTSSIAFLLYPFSLVLVYVLDYIFGWT